MVSGVGVGEPHCMPAIYRVWASSSRIKANRQNAYTKVNTIVGCTFKSNLSVIVTPSVCDLAACRARAWLDFINEYVSINPAFIGYSTNCISLQSVAYSIVVFRIYSKVTKCTHQMAGGLTNTAGAEIDNISFGLFKLSWLALCVSLANRFN